MKLKDKLLLILSGTVTGVVSGFFGGGGGMIVVPMLVLINKSKQKTAHATAIAIMLPIILAGAIVNILGGSFETKSALPTTIGVFVGGILGALLLKKINNAVLSKLFAVVMLVAGVKMLFF